MFFNLSFRKRINAGRKQQKKVKSEKWLANSCRRQRLARILIIMCIFLKGCRNRCYSGVPKEWPLDSFTSFPVAMQSGNGFDNTGESDFCETVEKIESSDSESDDDASAKFEERFRNTKRGPQPAKNVPQVAIQPDTVFDFRRSQIPNPQRFRVVGVTTKETEGTSLEPKKSDGEIASAKPLEKCSPRLRCEPGLFSPEVNLQF